MGLDMYLEKHYFATMKPKSARSSSRERDEKINGLPVKEKICEAVYWRKANAIHGWFVREVQGGEDNCQETEVTAEQLEALLKLVTKVLKTKNASLLAPTPGFFFGSTDVDEDYWDDLEFTKKELTRVLALHKKEKKDAWCWFTYRASW